MRTTRLATAVLLVAAVAAAPLAAGTYTFDPTHSSIGFAVTHLGLSKVRGEFGEYEGTVELDPENLTASSVEVSIVTSSIDTGNEQRDGHLRSGDFLLAAEHPTIEFSSTAVESLGGSEYAVTGDLTIRGVTQEVTIPVTLLGPVTGMRGEKRIGVEGGLTIDRHDFGVSWSRTLDAGGLVVGDEVDIVLNVEAVSSDG
ncbi:MAG: YceI family protein [Thermoanaerobaculia bacterium]|nr:YceI family protein [Thermoanaerobaculia bacterium]